MSIDILRENLREIDSNNIVKLISNVILHNLDHVNDHDINETYSRNDIVYTNDIASGKHMLYVCQKDNTTGAFNASDWEEYAFKLEKGAVIFDSTFTATVNNTTIIPINQPLFDPLNDDVVVYHSIAGRQIQGKDWNFNSDYTAIVLTTYPLYANEYVCFDIIK